jgi:peptidoglycan/LPS O-acetylase OafA/YrhL
VKHRADIDGLRAVAIVPVVLCHAGVPGFAGGFVGVDVFFVISGFLITSLIAGEIREGRFSIAHFYERRVRRIFPALFAMVLACAAVAPFLLPAEEQQSFGTSVAAVALFTSNAVFWSESGYFDAAADAKPLLHTWSLAVEEQFYIVFPLLLLLLQRFVPARGAAVLWVAAGVSLAACAQLTYRGDADAAFYLAPFRAWELALGALAALGALPPLQGRVPREAAAALGAALIAWSVFAFSDATFFPGTAALVPCVGALLLLHAGADATPVLNRVLSARPLVLIGLISYSLYLWHWPLLVFAKHHLQRPLLPPETALAVALALGLAWLSWRYVEQPFRRRGEDGIARRPLFAAAAVVMALALGAGAAGYVAGAPAAEIAEAARAGGIRGLEDYRVGNCFLNKHHTYANWESQGPCVTSHPAPRRALLWGDSFAAHYAPGLFDGKPDARYRFVQYTAIGCPPVPGVRLPRSPRCESVNDALGQVLERHPAEVVILAARWEIYWDKAVRAEQVEQTIKRLKDRGLYVVLVGQGPTFEFKRPQEYVQRTGSLAAPSRDHAAINAALRSVKGVDRFFDPADVLCKDGSCPLRDDGQFLYWDEGHYSSYGSKRVAAALLEVLPD